MIVAFTGHRPDKLGANPALAKPWIERQVLEELRSLKVTGAISGMAQGVDQWCASLCNYLQIPWVAAIPFKGQEERWPVEQRSEYRDLLATAKAQVVVSSGPYSPKMYQVRNEWMVDRCDYLIAVYNESAGGTRNTILYAHSLNVPVYVVDPRKAQ